MSRNQILFGNHLKPHPLNRGLVLWYPCEFKQGGYGTYTLRDFGGNNFHAAMTGVQSSYTAWKTDSPVSHNGSISNDKIANRYYEVPNDPAFEVSYPLTLAVWSKTSDGTASVVFEIGANNLSLQWTAAGDSLALHCGNFNKSVQVGAANLDDGVWRHYIFSVRTNGAGGGNAYLNGVENTGDNDPDPLSYTTPVISILSRTGSFPYGGLLSDIRLYNRALNAQEAMALYRESKNGNPNLLYAMNGMAHSVLPHEDVPGAGRIMGSLAGPGGLAGYGGVAGLHGGIAG